MKKRLIAVLIFCCGAALFGQNAGEGGSAPFVSELRAEARNNLIRLSWLDSRDVRGPVYVFRSARPFSGTVPPNIKPVSVAYGNQAYIDETDGLENIYYFVAASDTRGQRYDIIIPQTNTAAVSTLAAQPAESRAGQGIADLVAQSEGEGIRITFRVEGAAKNAVLYRSARAIRQPQDLLNAAVVQSGITSPFVDYPIPGASWYYAVVFEDEITGGSVQIRAGRNATVNPVETAGSVPTPQRSTEGMRAMPLPSMTVYNAAPEGTLPQGMPWKAGLEAGLEASLNGSLNGLLTGSLDVPQQVPLREETLRALENIQTAPLPAPPLKKPRVFARDLETPAGGEDSGLMRIVQSSFSKREWENARVDLLHFLSLPHSEDTEGRARFYLGQALYFTGSCREALIEFLSVQSRHPAEAKDWIEAALTEMTR